MPTAPPAPRRPSDDPPTDRLALPAGGPARVPTYGPFPGPPVSGRGSGATWWLVGGVAVALILVLVLGVVLVQRSGRGIERLAMGSWTCTTQGDEDTDVYGDADHTPFEVVVGDGTFSIPSRQMSGTWTFTNGSLHVDSVWSRVRSRPSTSLDVSGLPTTSQDQAAGDAPMAFRPNATGRTFGRDLTWSYSGGQLIVSGGTGIATTGLVCEKGDSSGP